MRINQEQVSKFKPITITIESAEELRLFYAGLVAVDSFHINEAVAGSWLIDKSSIDFGLQSKVAQQIVEAVINAGLRK